MVGKIDRLLWLKDYFSSDLVDAANNYAHDEGAPSLSPFKVGLISLDLNDEQEQGVLKIYKGFAESDAIYNFLSGVKYAVKNHVEDYHADTNISDYAKNKDLCIMVNFGDNDFGSCMERAGKIFAETYNAVMCNVNLYTERNAPCEKYVEEIEKMESLDNLKKLIQTAFVSSYFYNEVVRWYGKIPDVREVMDRAFNATTYLGLHQDSTYKIGTYAEIEKFVVEEYKEMQSEGEGSTLDTCWLNGEFLFMCVKDGYMKIWRQ